MFIGVLCKILLINSCNFISVFKHFKFNVDLTNLVALLNYIVYCIINLKLS